METAVGQNKMLIKGPLASFSQKYHSLLSSPTDEDDISSYLLSNSSYVDKKIL